jgi:hypothetical protein
VDSWSDEDGFWEAASDATGADVGAGAAGALYSYFDGGSAAIPAALGGSGAQATNKILDRLIDESEER